MAVYISGFLLVYVALFGSRLSQGMHSLTQSTAEQCNIHTPTRTH